MCQNKSIMATGFLYLNTRNELIRLDCSKIVYMEGDGNYTNIVLVNKQKVAVCMNLSNMQQFISESFTWRSVWDSLESRKFKVIIVLNLATVDVPGVIISFLCGSL
mgnify:CR=1 FL=1